MRNRFDNQLEKLNNELIEMGSMIEQAIEKAISALVNNDVELAKTVIEGDEDIDHQERRIESLCMKLLLQQQPVAKDFRLISSALKMITDMERIGDHAADISEMTVWIYGENYVTHLNLLEEMAKLFTECTDPIEIIKWKEILSAMEDVIDGCEDLVGTFRRVVLKYA